MVDRASRWDLFLDRLEAGHWLRRTLIVGGVISLGGVTLVAGLFLHPTPVPPSPTLVVGTPASMMVNGLSVRNRAAITRVVRDLNNLVTFSYANADRWTVVVQRDGCELVTAGGFWPRTSADPTLLRDLDAIVSQAVR